MRVLLSTIGSRGDVQPLVALALELKALGQEVRLCAPPDFRDWIDALGIPVTPIGPELRKLTASTSPPIPTPLSPDRRRQMVEATVATQFETVAAAARDCDVIVGATALQIAARSVAERLGIAYVFAAYCPTVLPSAHHAPIPLGGLGEKPAPPTADNRELWARDPDLVDPPRRTPAAASGIRRTASWVEAPASASRPRTVTAALLPWPTRGSPSPSCGYRTDPA